MKVLIIKTSSLGDVIHTLPALTDAGKMQPTIRFDWVVENAFAEIPTWHPLVDRVIPIALRRWRRNPYQAWRSGEWQAFIRQLQAVQYDFVIDAQGLLKSAFLTRFARGVRCGLDFKSAREAFASLFYQRKFSVVWEQHAVVRARQLFAQVLNYPVPAISPEYKLQLPHVTKMATAQPYVVFLHGTTWATKHWPENYWIELAQAVTQAGWSVKIPWGNPAELARAQRIAATAGNIEVLPKLNLAALSELLLRAKAAVAVDTGLGHLAAALGVPTLSLYGPTDPVFTGAVGDRQMHLAAQFSCAPCLSKNCTFKGAQPTLPACFATLAPVLVWQKLQELLAL